MPKCSPPKCVQKGQYIHHFQILYRKTLEVKVLNVNNLSYVIVDNKGVNVTTLALTRNVTAYIAALGQDIWKKVRGHFSTRVKACLARGGSHFEHIDYHAFAFFFS